MRVDFYQLSHSPVEIALPQLAAKMIDAGARVLVIAGDELLQGRISAALWGVKDQFLAHGLYGGEHDARQPILIGNRLDAANGATYLALADGQWVDGAETLERVFLLFDGSTIDDARATWRKLGEIDGLERNYWRQLSPTSWEKAA